MTHVTIFRYSWSILGFYVDQADGKRIRIFTRPKTHFLVSQLKALKEMEGIEFLSSVMSQAYQKEKLATSVKYLSYFIYQMEK